MAETPKPKPDCRTTAQRKRAKMRDELREKFKAMEYIRQLELAYDEYEKMLVELDVAKIKKKDARGNKEKTALLNAQIDLFRMRIDIVKNKIDLNLRRLKFCLPELKAIELSDPLGGNPFSAFADLVKAINK